MPQENPVPDIQDENITTQLVNIIVNLQSRVAQLEANPSDTLEIKTTTGDYAAGDSWDGRRVLNTFDHTYKIFENNLWRTLFP